MLEAGIQERMWKCSRVLKAQNYIVSATFFWPTQATRSAQILRAADTLKRLCMGRDGKFSHFFAINFPYYLKSFQFHQEVITILHY